MTQGNYSLRRIGLAIAKGGFQNAMRRAQYAGRIGDWYYAMNRDDWTMTVEHPDKGGPFTFKIAKSWQP